ncbi:hypothetical protein G9A89_003999 [Geosiphon pyriformis]|nr:hypothetical protein G9A89_003999 [Geosiphon pyriformis]
MHSATLQDAVTHAKDFEPAELETNHAQAIDDFLIEVNDIIMPIKILIMKATQYQALISNNWLFKTNAMLD